MVTVKKQSGFVICLMIENPITAGFWNPGLTTVLRTVEYACGPFIKKSNPTQNFNTCKRERLCKDYQSKMATIQSQSGLGFGSMIKNRITAGFWNPGFTTVLHTVDLS